MVHIVENGVPVHGLTVQSLRQSSGNEFGLVVVIDVSPTQASIVRAATVARDISTLRPSGEQFGLVEADSTPPVVLSMTQQPGAISGALAAVPTITRHGEHLWNAALTGVELLAGSRINAGSVIVLSDGADRGDPSTLNQLVASAAAAHVRIFTIGITSPHFSASILQDMATRTGGQFYAARFPQLRVIFDTIEAQLTNQYIIRYYSVQGLGKVIPASIRINGISGTYTITYTSPTLTAATFAHQRPPSSFWASTQALVAVPLACALLLLLGVSALVRRRRLAVHERVGAFLPASPEPLADVLFQGSGQNILFERAQRALAGARWWMAFEREVEVAQIDQTPIELVSLAVATSVVIGLVLYEITGSLIAGILATLTGPVVARMAVSQRLARQQRLFAEQLGEHLQEVAAAMRAGRSLVDALVLVTETASEPLRREFELALADERLGMPLDEALGPIGGRMANPDMEQVALVAALDRTTGASTADVLDRVSDGVRENAELRRELRALTAQASLSRWILTALPVLVLILISVSDAAYERPMYHTTFGILLLILSAISVVAGSLVMRRLARINF
jgi:tight adherence protein B